jgi:hypothetical protein
MVWSYKLKFKVEVAEIFYFEYFEIVFHRKSSSFTGLTNIVLTYKLKVKI